jgi:hypothetical protein
MQWMQSGERGRDVDLVSGVASGTEFTRKEDPITLLETAGRCSVVVPGSAVAFYHRPALMKLFSCCSPGSHRQRIRTFYVGSSTRFQPLAPLTFVLVAMLLFFATRVAWLVPSIRAAATAPIITLCHG